MEPLGAPRDSVTVNLRQQKVISLEQDKRNSQTLLRLGFCFVWGQCMCVCVGGEPEGVLPPWGESGEDAAHPTPFRNLAGFCFRRPWAELRWTLLIDVK